MQGYAYRSFPRIDFIGSIGHIWVARCLHSDCKSTFIPQIVHLLQSDYFTSKKYQLRPSWRKIYTKNFMRQFNQMTIYSERSSTEIPTQYLKGHHTCDTVGFIRCRDMRCTYRSFPRTFIDSIGHIWVGQGLLTLRVN